MNGLMATDQVLVLGIGNLLWADEGFGVRCAETLRQHYRLPESTVVMDGGTQGLYLLPYVQQASHLLVFDAVDYGLPPGELIEVHDDEVPKFTGAKKMSLHQTGFQEVLSAADFTGRYPRRLTLIGVQACQLDNWGGGLTEVVRSRVEPAVNRAAEVLQAWGVTLQRSDQPAEPLLCHGLDWGNYERQGAPEVA